MAVTLLGSPELFSERPFGRARIHHAPGRFIVLEVLFGRHAPDCLADDIQRQILDSLETHARFAHVQLLAGLRPCRAKPFCRRLVPVDAHEIQCTYLLPVRNGANFGRSRGARP
jgi:hypothetical protein